MNVDCLGFPQHETCYMFSNKPKCCTAPVHMSNACLSFAPCQQHVSDSHFATGLWQVHNLGATAKGTPLTAFLLVLLKLVLIVSLHCLFQAHTHSTFQQLTFAHTGTGWAFCCFFCGGFFLVFFLASTCCLILRLSTAVQRGLFLPSYLAMHRSVSDHWLEFFASVHPLLGSDSWAASHQAAAGKCSPPLPEMWLWESAVITLKGSRRWGGAVLVCEKVLCTHTDPSASWATLISQRAPNPSSRSTWCFQCRGLQFSWVIALAFILSPTLLCREPPWLILCVLFFPPFSVCSHNQPAALCWSIPWSSFLLCLAEAALFSRLNYPLCFFPLLGSIGSSWCSLWKL